MNRVFARIGAVSLVAIATVAILAGPGEAAVPRPSGSSNLQVDFAIRGDLESLRGETRDLRCVDRVQPTFFKLMTFSKQVVEVESSRSASCEKNEVIVTWLLTTEAKSSRGPSDAMEVRLRYGTRAQPSVEFLRIGKALEGSSRVLSDSRVAIEITGR